MSVTDPVLVVCAGDRFITDDVLAAAVRAELPDARTVTVRSAWPDVPFGDVDGVREAAGDPAELAALVADADVLVTHLAPVTASVIAAAGRLRLIGSVRGGPVNVDVDAATARGIPVAYLPGRNLEAAAEYTIGMMLAVTRHIGAGARQLAAGEWDGSWFRADRIGPELQRATVGLVGLGAIGHRVAELLQGFGATVLGHDPFADAAGLHRAGIEAVGLDELLGRSDIVSLHARLTPGTRRMMDAAAFGAMRPGSYFVNTARGELVDTDALREAVLSGHLAGVACDVFDPEPPAPDDPLLAALEVVATPHLAGGSREVATGSAQRLARAVRGFLAGEGLPHCANPETLTR